MSMKKLVFVFLVVFFSNYAYTVELWSGFTSNMSKDQVSSKVFELFNINRPFYESSSTGVGFDTGSIFIGHHYSSGPIHNSIFYNTNNPAYPIIVFHFRNNRLYIIEVRWGADAETLLNRHKNQFGNPNEIKTAKSSEYNALGRGGYYEIVKNDYKWTKQEIYIYLAINIYPSNFPTAGEKKPVISFFVDRAVYDAWYEEQNRELRQQKEAEELKKRATSEGITF
jgi:hypothetical protein